MMYFMNPPYYYYSIIHYCLTLWTSSSSERRYVEAETFALIRSLWPQTNYQMEKAKENPDPENCRYELLIRVLPAWAMTYGFRRCSLLWLGYLGFFKGRVNRPKRTLSTTLD